VGRRRKEEVRGRRRASKIGGMAKNVINHVAKAKK